MHGVFFMHTLGVRPIGLFSLENQPGLFSLENQPPVLSPCLILKNIWEATLNVANSANGEKILYDISPIKKDSLPNGNIKTILSGSKPNSSSFDNSIAPLPENVNASCNNVIKMQHSISVIGKHVLVRPNSPPITKKQGQDLSRPCFVFSLSRSLILPQRRSFPPWR